MLNWFKKDKKEKEKVSLYAPMDGCIKDLADVPDAVFSGKMLGDGFAVDPVAGQVVSPCEGTIRQIFPTKHAIGIETPEGLEILIHVGIDTVELKGEGFTAHVEAGSQVKVGDLLLEVDLDAVKAAGKSLITPIVITNMDKVESLTWETAVNASVQAVAGQTVAVAITLK